MLNVDAVLVVDVVNWAKMDVVSAADVGVVVLTFYAHERDDHLC